MKSGSEYFIRNWIVLLLLIVKIKSLLKPNLPVVKLQKRFAYKYKDKDHYKHIVTIPDEFIEKLVWKSDIELEPTLKKDKLVLRTKRKND